ncbi:MAG: hybrid sensor histidine kinase/response regulator [Rubrivivax sp.]
MTDPVLKILAVDDTPQNLVALRAVFDGDPFELLTAESGPAALELLLRHEFALALLDVQMPDMDGFALAELMRGAERTRHVPIIFLTAGAQDEHRSFRGYEAGAVDFLYKPLDARVLRSKVQVFTDLHRQRTLLGQRLEANHRLQRLNAMMLSALSHDIRTPLTVLSLNAELLVRRGDPVGRRMKAATAMLALQVEHLVNLAQRPDEELRAEPVLGSVGELVRARIAAPANLALVAVPVEFTLEGDDRAMFDPALLAQAVDQLLLQAAVHAGEGPVRITISGQGQRSVQVRLSFDAVPSASAVQHLFGGGPPQPGLAMPRVGPGLMQAERLARAHGGSLIGRAKEREGTLFELILPRAPLDD